MCGADHKRLGCERRRGYHRQARLDCVARCVNRALKDLLSHSTITITRSCSDGQSSTLSSRQDAIEKLEWYAMRRKIGRFHKILKSGCKEKQSKLRSGRTY